MLRRLTTFGRCLPAILLLYWAALFAGTHWPNLVPPRALAIDDKTLHFLGYAGLAFLAAAYAFRQGRVSFRRLGFLLFAVAAYGVLDEILQIPVPGRNAEFNDWLADLVGVLTGAGMYMVLQRVVQRLVVSRSAAQAESANADVAESREPSSV